MKIPDLELEEREALHRFVEYLETTIAERLVSIALFGSKARGESHHDSDLDVLVIILEDDSNLRRNIQRQAARISLEFDLILSPRIIGAPRWEEMRDFSLYRNVVRESSGLTIRGKELVLQPAGNV